MARLQVGNWYKYKTQDFKHKNQSSVFYIHGVRRLPDAQPQVGWIGVNTQTGEIDKDPWGKITGSVNENWFEKLKSLVLKSEICHKLLKVIFEKP